MSKQTKQTEAERSKAESNMFSSLDELRKEAASWNGNEYATANTLLYKILSGCYSVYLEVRKQKSLQAQLLHWL